MALYRRTTTSTGAPTTIEYFDTLNRVVMTETTGFHGAGENASLVETLYNRFGQVGQISRPYAADQATKEWTSYVYDDIGRVIRENASATGLTTTAYQGLTTVVTNDKGQVTKETKNARGLTTATIDAFQNATTNKAVRYAYDPVGNLEKVTDSAGNATVNVYNVRGHKTSTRDPDMGLWRYGYNVLGELIEQTDAKGQLACFEYDRLGRMRERIKFAGAGSCDTPPAAHEQATWVYDTAAHGKGKLASETNPGFRRTYTYDGFSRPASTTTSIGGLSYATSLSYDVASRVAVITYPTDFAVRNVYKPWGYLESVQRVGSAQVYWSAVDANAAGQITHESLGNGLSTHRRYEPASGRIDTITTGLGSAVQRLDYLFDELGNLEQREDVAQGLTERFLYDELNRLTRATTVTGGVTLTKTVGYDALGNIKTKSDLSGTYGYGPARPHAVSSADGGKTYTYDANGNMTGGAQRTLTWNVANLPTQITKGGAAVYFSYGPDRARFKQVTTGTGAAETTLYIGGLYEHITKDTLTTRRHYIQAGGKTIAVYTTRNTGAEDIRYLHRDHLGSVDAITNESGQVVERLSYDAWGKRRPANWTDPVGQLTTSLKRGFTGHEHLDDVGLIHMNGRVYHPSLGRFISADPFVQFPKASQSLNRYGYVLNNPLSYTDPSGFGIFSELLDFSHEIDPLARVRQLAGQVHHLAADRRGGGRRRFGVLPNAVDRGRLQRAYYQLEWRLHRRHRARGCDCRGGGVCFAGGGGRWLGPLWGGGRVCGYRHRRRSGQWGGVRAELLCVGVYRGGFGGDCGAIKNPVLGPTIAATIGGTASEISGGKFANGAISGAFGYMLTHSLEDPSTGDPLDSEVTVAEMQAAPEATGGEFIQVAGIRGKILNYVWKRLFGSRNAIAVGERRFGDKVGQHAREFGLDPSTAAGRAEFRRIIDTIGNSPDKVVSGTFRGQQTASNSTSKATTSW